MKRSGLKKAMFIVAWVAILIAIAPSTSRALTSAQLRGHVVRELQADPRIDASKLDVAVQNKIYVVSGTVFSFGEYQVVERLMQGLVGSQYNIAKIKVVPQKVDDKTIVTTIHAIIPSYCLTRINDLKVQSKDGNVRLEGVTSSLHHRMSAEHAATQIRGVRSIDNRIRVTSESPSDEHTRNYIMGLAQPYIKRYGVKDFRVVVKNGVVSLSGFTSSYEARRKLVELAEMAPGVTRVINNIRTFMQSFDEYDRS